MTALRALEWMVFLASIHRLPGWMMIAACVAFAGALWLRGRVFDWYGGTR